MFETPRRNGRTSARKKRRKRVQENSSPQAGRAGTNIVAGSWSPPVALHQDVVPAQNGATIGSAHDRAGAWAPALRLVDPPKPIAPPVAAASRAGPFRLSESWWEHPVERDYYQLVDPGGALVLVFRDLRDGGWYLQGVFD
jgi:hypothetical protein